MAAIAPDGRGVSWQPAQEWLQSSPAQTDWDSINWGTVDSAEVERLKESLLETVAACRHQLEHVRRERGRPKPLFDPTIRRSVHNVVFAIDISGSMHDSLPFVRAELKRTLERLPARCAFNIVAFNGQVFSWAPGLLHKDESSVRSATTWLQGLLTHGTTNTLDALRQAFTDDSVECVWVLTDGRPDETPARVLQATAAMNVGRQVAIHTISFDCNDGAANAFLRSLAEQNNGTFRLFTAEDVEAANTPVFRPEDEERLQVEINRCLARYDQCERLLEQRLAPGLVEPMVDPPGLLHHRLDDDVEREFDAINSYNGEMENNDDNGDDTLLPTARHDPAVLEGMRVVVRTPDDSFFTGTIVTFVGDGAYDVQLDASDQLLRASLRDFVPLVDDPEAELKSGDYVVANLASGTADAAPTLVPGVVVDMADQHGLGPELGAPLSYRVHTFVGETLVLLQTQLCPVPFWFLSDLFHDFLGLGQQQSAFRPSHHRGDTDSAEASDGKDDFATTATARTSHRGARQQRTTQHPRQSLRRQREKELLALEVEDERRKDQILVDRERARELEPVRRAKRALRDAERERRRWEQEHRSERRQAGKAATIQQTTAGAHQQQELVQKKFDNLTLTLRREEKQRRQEWLQRQHQLEQRKQRVIKSKAKQGQQRRQEQLREQREATLRESAKVESKRQANTLRSGEVHTAREVEDSAAEEADRKRREKEIQRLEGIAAMHQERTQRNAVRIEARSDRVGKQRSEARQREQMQREEAERLSRQRRLRQNAQSEKAQCIEEQRQQQAQRQRDTKFQALRSERERQADREQANQTRKAKLFESKQVKHKHIHATYADRQQDHESRQQRKLEARRNAQMQRQAELESTRAKHAERQQRRLETKRKKAEGVTATLLGGTDAGVTQGGDYENRAHQNMRMQSQRNQERRQRLARSTDVLNSKRKEIEEYKYRNENLNRFASNHPNQSNFVLG
eukprot:m.415143 g.415143  ORF g.415143 m.415143 type:complete len:973 (+) comp20177_c2_seq8:286-3204(+)